MAGFKLDTLLKLSDVKGVDRKTSLLHFVVASLLKRHCDRPGGIATLSAQLSAVKPAANLQASAAPQHPPSCAAENSNCVAPQRLWGWMCEQCVCRVDLHDAS